MATDLIWVLASRHIKRGAVTLLAAKIRVTFDFAVTPRVDLKETKLSFSLEIARPIGKFKSVQAVVRSHDTRRDQDLNVPSAYEVKHFILVINQQHHWRFIRPMNMKSFENHAAIFSVDSQFELEFVCNCSMPRKSTFLLVQVIAQENFPFIPKIVGNSKNDVRKSLKLTQFYHFFTLGSTSHQSPWGWSWIRNLLTSKFLQMVRCRFPRSFHSDAQTIRL